MLRVNVQNIGKLYQLAGGWWYAYVRLCTYALRGTTTHIRSVPFASFTQWGSVGHYTSHGPPTLLPFFLSRFTLSLPLLTFCRYALKTKNVEKRGGLAVIIVDLATSHARPLIMPQFWREWGSCVGGTKAADPYTTDATGAACKTGGGASGWVSFLRDALHGVVRFIT